MQYIFLKKSCLIAADGGTWHGQHTTVAMHHIRDITKPPTMLLLHYDMVRGCLGDVSNEDLAIIKNKQFTNLIE